MIDFKWIRPNIDLFYIALNSKNIVQIMNSGNLEKDFYEYANIFFEAAECVMKYLLEVASNDRDIAKLDLWYYAMIYLYRQSLELLLKATIFQNIGDTATRKKYIGIIRHDLEKAFEELISLKNMSIVDNENIKWLKEFFSDISYIDKESDMFRYPFGMDMKVLFQKQTHISLIETGINFNQAFKSINHLYNTGKILEECINTPSKLIIEGGSYYKQSVVGYKYHHASFYPYYTSYIEVGNFLKNYMINSQKSNLFLPMCYLYRNAVELALKRIIVEDIFNDDMIFSKILKKKKHSILGLWNSIVEELKKYANNSQDTLEIDNATQYITKFHNYDLNSDIFRYPCDKNMNSYFLNLTKFDINNVSSCFEELCNFLDAVDTMINEIKNIECEINSYYKDY